ncbi:two-component system, response regulator YesN [Halolactibacillus alkaliphilus]|nr:two-component system, response regulator YesN [Halolactibacillus alkaliphilus]
MIVDDERVERESMRQIITKAFKKVELTLAENGQEAVDKAMKDRPDIVLMDIKMPEINGLEAIQLIQDRQPNIKFIMVTAYDTFDYAKEALKMGVKDYLLKPSKITEILTTLEKVMEEVQADQEEKKKSDQVTATLAQSKKVMERDLVTQLLLDHVHDVEAPLLMDYVSKEGGTGYGVLLLMFKDKPLASYSEMIKGIEQFEAVLVGPLYHKQLPFIILRDSQSYRQQVVYLARAIKQAFERLNQPVQMGVSDEIASLDRLSAGYQQAVVAAMETKRPYQVMYYDDLPKSENVCDKKLDSYITERFFEDLRMGKWDDMTRCILDISLCFQSEGLHVIEFKQRIIQLLYMMGQTLDEMHINVNWQKYHFKARDYAVLSEEIKQYFNQLKEDYIIYHAQLADDWFTKMKHHIQTHIQDDLSLEHLSDEAGLSPIYVSKVFKERLGMNYIDFLTKCRIDRAKQLLEDDTVSIKSIAGDVGYQDANYFSKVFKKVTGETPKTYRQQLIHKSY